MRTAVPTLAMLIAVTSSTALECKAAEESSATSADFEGLWSDGFSDTEKALVRTSIKAHGARLERTWSRILRADLDGDAKPEYVVTALIGDPQERPKRIIAILRRTEHRDDWITHSPDNTRTGQWWKRRIYTIDFDGDGLEDIVDQRFFHIGGGEAERYALILKFDGKSLKPVYSNDSYDVVRFEDLDNDAQVELIEITDEFGIPIGVFWPVVYRWRNGKWVEDSASFPEFYAGKAAIYRAALRDAVESSALLEEKLGQPSWLHQGIIRAMEAYLTRVSEIVGPQITETEHEAE